MRVKIKKNVLSQDLFSKSIEEIDRLVSSNILEYDHIQGRFGCHNNSWFSHLQDRIIFPIVKDLIGHDQIKPSYNYIGYYNKSWSHLAPHMDRPQAGYTFDLCLMSNDPWPLFFRSNKYLLNKNDGILFSGSDNVHWRERIKPENGIVCLIFFHYVKMDFDGSVD